MSFKDYLREENESESERGFEIEKEHKDLFELVNKKIEDGDPISEEDFYSMIVNAHLKEIPDYYTRLEKMEEEAKE